MANQSPHTLQVLLTGLQEINASLSLQEIPKRVILLMGQTKAGKTTLFYYLLGKKLIWQKNQLDVWQMRPQTRYFNALIGDGYDSTTVYPNIPVSIPEDAAMVIDMPGFDDTRPHYRLLNIHILLYLLKLVQNVHICQVIPEQNCQSDALIREFQKVSTIFNKNILLSSKYLSFIITKVENQHIREVFLSQIDDVIQSQIISHLQEQLNSFKSKNMYEFANKKPQQSEGAHLKERIQSQNEFYSMEREPRNILSQNYYQEMIGKTNLEQFMDYLNQIIENIKQATQLLPSLCLLIFKVEFYQIIASALRIDKGEYLQQSLQQINSKNTNLPLADFTHAHLEARRRTELTKEVVLAILKCFDPAYNKKYHQNRLINCLFHLADLISLVRTPLSVLIDDYLQKVQDLLKGLAHLILIIEEVKLEQAQEKLTGVTKNQRFFTTMQSLHIFWDQNCQSIINTQYFSQFSKDQEIRAYMNKKNLVMSEAILRKVSKYQKPRGKKMIPQGTKVSPKLEKKPTSISYPDLLRLTLEQAEKALANLPLSHQTLSYLKSQYDSLAPEKDKWLIKKTLVKLSEVLYCFSFFEEAIMFKMAFADGNSIEQLFVEGVQCQEISVEFIRSILIAYYSMVEKCFNSIFDLADSPEGQLQIETERIDVFLRMQEHHENCYLLLDRYKPLELYYINPIMQRFEYYQKQIQKKEFFFNKSPIASLAGFVNKK